MLNHFITTTINDGTVIIEFNKDNIIVFDITGSGENIAIFKDSDAWDFLYSIAINTLDDLEPLDTYYSSGLYYDVKDYTYNIYILPN